MEIFEIVKNVVVLIVCGIGSAIAIPGIIEAATGYSNQSSGKMSDGIVKAVGGAIVIVVGYKFVPSIFSALIP